MNDMNMKDMESDMVDLGVKYKPYNCSPCSGSSDSKEKDRIRYPTLYISDKDELEGELPDGEFYFLAKAVKTRSTKETNIPGTENDCDDDEDENGDEPLHEYSCEITVMAIKVCDEMGGDVEYEEEDASESLDKAIDNIVKAKKKTEYTKE